MILFVWMKSASPDAALTNGKGDDSDKFGLGPCFSPLKKHGPKPNLFLRVQWDSRFRHKVCDSILRMLVIFLGLWHLFPVCALCAIVGDKNDGYLSCLFSSEF